MAPAVSAVMPVRDGAAFLDAAIASIRAQSFQDFECIVVDDGSTDGSSAILSRHAGEDARIRIVSQPALGIAAALNRGIAEAGAPLIARMDADDEMLPERLAVQVAVFAGAPEVALVGGAMEVVDAAGPSRGVRQMPCAPAEISAALLRGNCIAHPTVMMRRDAVWALGGYRAAFRHCEDYDLWLRLAERHQLMNLDAVLLRYREHVGQATWRDLERRILGELGALAAARCRRAGEADPTDGGDAIDSAFLLKAGMSEAQVSEETIRRGMDAARDAAAAGHWEAVRAALALVRRQPTLRRRTRLRAAMLSARVMLG